MTCSPGCRKQPQLAGAALMKPQKVVPMACYRAAKRNFFRQAN